MSHIVVYRRVAAALVLVVLGGCSGPTQKRAASRQGSSRPMPALAPRPVQFSVTGAEMRGTGETLALPGDVQAGVLGTLDRYLSDAIVTPLRTGAPPADLAPLFTDVAWPRLTGPDRAAIVDEGLPAGPVTADAATANLTGLVGPDGAVALVGVSIDVRLKAGPLSVVRQGEFVLVPENGAWKIDGYDLRVARDTLDGTASTTPGGSSA